MTTFLSYLGVLQGLVLAGVVASLGGTVKKPNRALALLLLCFSIGVLSITGQHAGLFGRTI